MSMATDLGSVLLIPPRYAKNHPDPGSAVTCILGKKQPQDLGDRGMVVLLCPLVISGYRRALGPPGVLKRACPLR
jgi:hypothetical protein